MAANDPYQTLMTSLTYPDSNRLRAILEYLMTDDQAMMVASLPGTAKEVAEKTGFDEDRVKTELDALFFKGVVFPRGDFVNREYFRFARAMGQLHDATQASKHLDVKKDQEFFKLWHDFAVNEWYPDRGKEAAQSPKPRSRIIPAYKSIKDLPDVLPCEDFREVLKAQSKIAVVPCPCRSRTTAVDEHCPVCAEEERWNCFQLGRGAEYVVARDTGKELSVDEALELCDKIEDDGLLHVLRNDTSMTGHVVSCQCCTDCCLTAVPLKIAGAPYNKVWEKSRFIAVADEEACTGCQTCVDRCQFDAIDMVKPEGAVKSKKLKAKVDPEACYGCGVCVVGCDEAYALSMKMVRPPDHIPAGAA